MTVYLIQTSGAEIATTADPAYVAAAKGPRFCDEPLKHHRYFNAEPFWQQGFQRRRAWQTASEGDVALLYCTGSVDDFPSCISHLLRITEKRIVEGEGAWLEFERPIELDSPIAYSTIQSQLEQGDFSKGMEQCGREGFNFRRVRNSDLQKVRQLSELDSAEWDRIL